MVRRGFLPVGLSGGQLVSTAGSLNPSTDLLRLYQVVAGPVLGEPMAVQDAL